MSENKLLLIGKGSGSELYAYGQDEHRVVLKMVSSVNKKEQRHLKNEYLFLKSMEHEHIIKALRYQENVAFMGNKMDKQLTSTNNILVLEYAQQGSLLQYITKHQLDITTKRLVFRQVLSAVQYLHRQAIAHRDLKLQNILVGFQTEGLTVKVSDFGFASRFIKEQKVLRFAEYKGTRKGYMAPEIHRCQKDNTKVYDASKCDIFALGVILFALVLGKLPFEFATEDNKLYGLIMEQKFQEFWKFHHQINEISHQEGFLCQQFQQLFQRMVSHKPEARPTATQALQSSWII